MTAPLRLPDGDGRAVARRNRGEDHLEDTVPQGGPDAVPVDGKREVEVPLEGAVSPLEAAVFVLAPSRGGKDAPAAQGEVVVGHLDAYVLQGDTRELSRQHQLPAGFVDIDGRGPGRPLADLARRVDPYQLLLEQVIDPVVEIDEIPENIVWKVHTLSSLKYSPDAI